MIQFASIIPILIAVAVLIVGGIVAYFVARSMKGKMELELVKSGFNTGEEVGGTVTISTKKSLELRRMFVALVGTEVIERRDNSEDGTRTERNEVYRDEVNLEEAQTLAAGFNKSYPISFTAPGAESVGSSADRDGGISLSLGSLTIGSGHQHRRMEWRVEARADLPGVDLGKSKSLRINVW